MAQYILEVTPLPAGLVGRTAVTKLCSKRLRVHYCQCVSCKNYFIKKLDAWKLMTLLYFGSGHLNIFRQTRER